MSFDSVNPSAETVDNSFWSILREAVWGTQRDFTQGSLGVALFILSVPMIVEMFAESLFAVVDIFFVAHLGANAVAVVGITESMMYLIYSVAIGLSVGATAMVARRIGEKDPDGAAKAATHAIYIGLVVSVVLGVIGLIFAGDFLRLMGAEEASRLRAGEAPVMMVRDETVSIDVPAMTADNVAELFQSVATREQLQELQKCGDISFIYVFQNSTRFAITATMQFEAFALTIKSLGRQT